MAYGGHGAGGGLGLPGAGDCIAGKYRVERLLGAGGMGAVLAAQHLVLGSRVAIKVLLPAAAQLPDAVERFLREARAAAALCGEHVARVLDTGTLDTGMPFLVMEYLSGRDLGKILAERSPLPLEEAADYMLQACDAMAEAHGLGIVHRDLKPANLFVVTRPNGSSVLKVLDFGLAKILDGARTEAPEASLTNTGMVIGTPHYMPPEQLRGLKFADARSDIWSLGVIGYQVLTGRRPFVGVDPIGVITAIVGDEPVAPSALRPEIPPAIEAVLLRCLRKDPTQRTQTVQEIAAAFEPFTPGRRRGSFASVTACAAGSTAMPPAAPTAAPSAPRASVALDALAPAVPGPRISLASAAGGAALAPGIAQASSAADNPTMVGGTVAATIPHVPPAPTESARDVTTLTLGSSEVRAASAPRSRRGWWLVAGGAAALGVVAVLAVVVGLRRGEQPGPMIITPPMNAATGMPGPGDAPAPTAAVTAGGTASSAPSAALSASAGATGGAGERPRTGSGPVPGAAAPLSTPKGAAGAPVAAAAPTKPAAANTIVPSTTSKPAASTPAAVPFDPLKNY